MKGGPGGRSVSVIVSLRPGSIGVGPADTEATRQMIAAVRSRTDRPFNVNVFCNQLAVADAPSGEGGPVSGLSSPGTAWYRRPA